MVQWVRKNFSCDVCQARTRPKPRRISAIPKSFRLNHVVGVDLVFLRMPGKEKVPYLNATCWGSHYQMLQKVPKGKKKALNVWLAFCRSWLRVFGAPEIIVVDEGKEFTA